MAGDSLLAILGERSHLHGDRVLLRVEADPEREGVGQPSVERDVALIVRAEEVDRAREQEAAADHHDRREDRHRPAEEPPPARAAPASRRGRASGRSRRASRSPVRPACSAVREISVGALLSLLGVGVRDPEGDRGDVVPAPATVGRVDELALTALRRVRDLDQDPADLVVGDHRRQAIAAEQEDIAVLGWEGHRVDVDVRLGAEGARDDRALWVLLGLLLSEAALTAELLDQRVVLGEALELAVPQHVGAAVADVPERHLVVAEHRGGERRSHARAGRVLLGEPVDLAVRRLGDLLELALGRFSSLTRPRRSKAPAAIREATSPACAPPIPSATANSGARAK